MTDWQSVTVTVTSLQGRPDRPCGNVWITSWVSSAEWDMWTIS